MLERESLKQDFFRGRPALEFKTEGMSVWEGMRLINLKDCDRITIVADGDLIKFQRNNGETYPYCLAGDPPISVSHPYSPPFEDKLFNSPISNTENLEARRTHIDSSFN